MPTITQLEYLVALDREMHFGKAARACHVSQPSLSAQIQKLEDELDVILFDRSKKPIVATESGMELVEQAKTVLREHKRFLDLAHQGSVEPRGPFQLSVIPTLAPYLIPLFINEFAHSYPNVQLKINEHKTDDIVRLLVNDEIDAGILVTPLKDDRLIERHLFFEPFYAYVSQQHPMSAINRVREHDLDISSLWILEEGHCFRNQVLKVCQLEKTATVLPNVEFASGNLETLKTLVRRSAGYTLLPELAVYEMSEEEMATYIKPFQKPVPTREVSIVHSRSFLKEKTISALESTILQSIPPKVKSLKKREIELVGIL